MPSSGTSLESEKTVESDGIKNQLIDFFNQIFRKENYDVNIYLEPYLSSASQILPLSALLKVSQYYYYNLASLIQHQVYLK